MEWKSFRIQSNLASYDFFEHYVNVVHASTLEYQFARIQHTLSARALSILRWISFDVYHVTDESDQLLSALLNDRFLAEKTIIDQLHHIQAMEMAKINQPPKQSDI